MGAKSVNPCASSLKILAMVTLAPEESVALVTLKMPDKDVRFCSFKTVLIFEGIIRIPLMTLMRRLAAATEFWTVMFGLWAIERAKRNFESYIRLVEDFDCIVNFGPH